MNDREYLLALAEASKDQTAPEIRVHVTRLLKIADKLGLPSPAQLPPPKDSVVVSLEVLKDLRKRLATNLDMSMPATPYYAQCEKALDLVDGLIP